LKLDEDEPERFDERVLVAETTMMRTSRDHYVFRCGAGLTSFHINSSGKMSICIMARKPAYDILEMGFMNAWKKIGELRDIERHAVTKCDTCQIRGYCVQCPGWSQLIHEDNESPVDFICEIAHTFAQKNDYDAIIRTGEKL